MKIYFLLFLLVLVPIARATTCYTNCESRFPKWYQEPDRKRCQAEKAIACLDPSSLPGPQDLSEFNSKEKKLRNRLLENFLLNGYVISLNADGEPNHQGDSLIWSSLAMASLPCRETEIEDAIIHSLEERDGALIRIEPLPEGYKKNATSRDQETGALFGFTFRSLTCPNKYEKFKTAWSKHYDFVKKHNQLYPGSNGNYDLSPGFQFVFDLVSDHFGKGQKPSKLSLRTFEAAILVGSKWVTKHEEACYPLHLSTLNAITSAKLGMPINEFTKREFCADTRGIGLTLTDWFCGRSGVSEYLDAFEVNRYEYSHQRCRWESTDVNTREQSPAVDFLILKTLAGG